MNKELNNILVDEETILSSQDSEQGELTLLFDFGGTLDTAGCHWGRFLWYAYKRNEIHVSEEPFREAYDTVT